MSALPKNWISVTIGEVTVPTTQREPIPTDEFEYIDIASIDRVTKIIIEPQILTGKNAPSRARKVVQTGDVLVSMTRPNLNAVARVPEKPNRQIASTGFDVLRAPELDSRWLFFAVRTSSFVEKMSDLVKGALYPAIGSNDIRSFRIPLAPFNEQKRIAERLEQLLKRVNSSKARLENVQNTLKRFKQSVLSAATTGKLTEGWRKENGISSEWSSFVLGELLSDLRYGTAQKSNYEAIDGIPVLRIPNISNGRIDNSDLKFGRFEEIELKALTLKENDILIIRSNGSVTLVGKAAIVGKEFEGYLFAGYLIRLRVKNELLNAQYLLRFLESPQLRQHIEFTSRSSSGINNINSEEIKNITILAPSLSEQLEIVRRVEKLFAFADQLEKRIQTAHATLERLTPSILAKAFRGELVPQDPTDEPASVLLERIQAARAKEAAVPKQRKPRQVKVKSVKTGGDTMKRLEEILSDHLKTTLQELNPNGQTLEAKALWQASELSIDEFYLQLSREISAGLLRMNEKQLSIVEAA